MSRTKRISQIVMILIIGFAFGSGIASAEYLGPDRVHTVIVSEACEYGVWVHDAEYVGECYKPDGVTPADACIDCGWECDPGSACGKANRYYSLGTRLVEHSVTTTDPEATVAITPNCGAWGDASWCLQSSSVTITANEPVSGEQITLIEGTQNGDAFACAANTCTVNVMGEGSNAFTYWALSSYGDSSRMGTHTALQDTIVPEINASVTGTMGDNGWFVSNATLSVAFTDTLPGSGISSSSALFNGILTDVSSPVTITEGVYNIQLDTRDAAGWTASASQTISVDTTAPAVTANQPPIEVANSNVTGGGYVNGSVVFTGTCSDATSGVDRIEISTDGKTLTSIAPNADGTWTLDWDSSMLSDGTYTPVITAVDAAGNRTDITMQPLTLDNSAPAMSMTGAWYIWDSGHIEVFDSRVGIEHIELSVRDGQNRWPAREWSYDTAKLVMDLQWDRKFGDGTVAPTGDYEVLLQAWDQLGNGRYITSRIYIPEAGATAVIPLGDVVSGGTFEDTPTPMAQQTQTEESGVVPAVPAATEEAPTPEPEPEPSSTPSSLSFSSAPIIPASGESKSTTLPVDPNLLTGAAALAAAASATAYSLQRKEEKEAERKRQEAESRAEAMAKVNAAQAVKEANYKAKCQLEDALGGKIPITSDFVAENPNIEKLYQHFKNTNLGIPSEGIDDETLSGIEGELTVYYEEKALQANLAKNAYMAANPEICAFIQSQERIKEENAIAAVERFMATNPETANFIISQERIKAENEAAAKAAAAKEAFDNYIANNPEVAAYISSQERIKAENEAYEELLANEAYENYLKKMERMEQETEARNVITPKTTFRDIVANVFNSASAGLGKLHDYGEKVWKDSIDWVDQHQTGVSIGVGFVVACAVIGIAVISLPVSLSLIAAATCVSIVLSGVITFSGTMLLNSYYGRDLATGMLRNVLFTGGAALLTGLLFGFVLGGPLLQVISGISSFAGQVCAAHPNACANIDLLLKGLDSAELTMLEIQYNHEINTGNPNAAWTAIEMEVERADGGFVGNYLIMEGLKYIQKYLPDALPYIQKYTIDIIPFLQKYGDEGMEFLDEYLKEGAEFVIAHWDDAEDSIGLAIEFGKPAMQLIDTVDVADARKLLNNLDAIGIENILKLDDNIIKSIADLDDIALKEFSGKLDEIINLGDEAISQVNQHGKDLIPFLSNYKDEGLQFIIENDNAAQFILKNWDDAPENVALAVEYGQPAMDLLDAVDNIKVNNPGMDFGNIQATAGKILDNQDLYKTLIMKSDALEAVLNAGPEAVDKVVGHKYGIKLVNRYGEVGVNALLDTDSSTAIILGQSGRYIDYLNPAKEFVRIPDQASYEIFDKINGNLKSLEIGKQLEAKVANYILENSNVQLTDFGNEITDILGQNIGDIDVATAEDFIEVKSSTSAIKLDQFSKYLDPLDDQFFNFENKKVIVYIEREINYSNPNVANMLTELEEMGVVVVNSLDELIGVIE